MALDPTTLLDKVEAAITARLDGGAIEEYSIRGRHLKYCSLDELMALRADLRREVEGNKTGLPLVYGVKDKRIAVS
jgi:hypothetical protein